MFRIVFMFLFSSFSVYANASSLAFSRNARTFESQHSTLVMKGLANSCLSLIEIPDGIPCNPAMTTLGKKSRIGAELQISNGYASLTNVRKLLDGKITQDLVDTLFTDGKIIQIEANADIFFNSKYLNGLFSPLSIKGFSVVRNEANPDVDLYAIEETGFVFQSGYEVFDNLYAGVQLKAWNRKFIKQRFKLVALGTQAGQDLLKPKGQSVTYVEPGFTYFLTESWKPRISLMIVNLGVVSKKYYDFEEPVEYQLGIGISPPACPVPRSLTGLEGSNPT